MPLDYNNVLVQLIGGLDTKTADQSTLPTKVLDLKNATFDRPGELGKRNGFSRAATGLPIAGYAGETEGIYPYKDSLLALSGSRLKAGDAATAAWRTLATTEGWEASQKAILANSGSQTLVDSAVIGDYACYCWEDSILGVCYQVTDNTTGTLIARSALVSAAGTWLVQPTVTAYGQYFYIFAVLVTAGTTNLVYYRIDSASPATVPTSTTVATGIGQKEAPATITADHHGQGTGVVTVVQQTTTPSYSFDILIDNQGSGFALYIDGSGVGSDGFESGIPYDLGGFGAAFTGIMVTFTGSFADGDTYRFLSPNQRALYDVHPLLTGTTPVDLIATWNTETVPMIARLNTAWSPTAVTVVSGTSGHLLRCMTLFHDSSNNVYVAWADHQTANIYVAVYNSTLTLVTAGYSIATATPAINITGYGGGVGSYRVLVTKPGTTHLTDHIVNIRHVQSPFPTTLSSTLYGCSLASRLMGTFFVVIHDSPLQPTYYVIDTSFNISAKLLPGTAGHMAASPLLPHFRLDASGSSLDFTCTYQNRVQSVNGDLTNSTGITNINLAPTISAPRQSAPLASTIHLGGGNILMYDGNSAVEHGFHYYPEEIIGQAPSDNPSPLSAPVNVTAIVNNPKIWGHIDAGYRRYKVTAKNTYGETLPSTDAVVTVDDNDVSVIVSWSAVNGAESYCVYLLVTATYRFLAEIQAQTNATTQQFIDDGKYTPGAAAPTSNTTGDAVSLPIDPPATVNAPIESYILPASNFNAAAHPIPYPINPTVTVISRGESTAPSPSYYGFVVVATNTDGTGDDSNPSSWAICTAGLVGAAPVGSKYVQLQHVDDIVQVSWTAPSWALGTVTYKVYGGQLNGDEWGVPILDDNGNPTPIHYVPFGSPGNTNAPPPFIGINYEGGSVTSFTASAGTVTLSATNGYFTQSMVGKNIDVVGATTAGNNGTFTVASVSDFETITYTNVSGATEGPTNASWQLHNHAWGQLVAGVSTTNSGNIQMNVALNNEYLPTSHDALTGDLAGGEYEYWITAVTAAGETAPIDYMQADVAVTGATGRVDLTWGKLTAAISYNVYRGTPAAGFDGADFVASLYNADFVPAMISWTDAGTSAATTTLAPYPNWDPLLVKDSKVNAGSLQTGTYGYVVASLTQFGETIGTAEVTATTAHNGVGYLVSWTAVHGAAGYAIYGRSSGKEIFLINVVRGTVLQWFDDGTIQGEATHQPQATNTTELTDHSYQYVCCYEWTDNLGQIHRSAPSVPIVQGRIGVVDAGNPTTLQIPTLTLTSKTYVSIGVYRTTVNGTIFYKVGSVPNDPEVDSVFFTDLLADNEIYGNEQLYTTGNVVENMEPGACLYPVLHQNRMFVVDALDRRIIWYSHQVIEGQPVEFSDFLKIVADEQGGDVTGLASMDSHLVVFRKEQISISNSLGLDRLGNGDNFNDLSKIPGDTGCLDSASIVSTNQGVFFRSERGIYMLDRSLQLRYVGAGVEKYLSYEIGQLASFTDGSGWGGSKTLEVSGDLTAVLPEVGEVLLVDHNNGCKFVASYTSLEVDDTPTTTINLLGVLPAEMSGTIYVYPFKWGGDTASVVSSAIALPNDHQVRFTLLGLPTILVYDWLVDQWSIFVPPFPMQTACLYQGKYTFIDYNGYVYQETPGVYEDVGAFSSWIQIGLSSAWIKLSGLTNFQRCRFVQLLGTRGQQDFLMDVQIQSDYKTRVVPVKLIDTSLWGSPGHMESVPLQARIQPNGEVQKSEAIQVILTDYSLTESATDRGPTLTGMTLEIGQKRGSQKHGHNY